MHLLYKNAVTCNRSVVSTGTLISSIKKLVTTIKHEIVDSGVKHHNPHCNPSDKLKNVGNIY
jgi:hypothetical protein